MSIRGDNEDQNFLECGRFSLSLSRPLVMGILNLTPDSFSDGGYYTKVDDALGLAESMISHGVNIIDVGAESTRPGSEDVSDEIEWSRLKNVLPSLISLKVPISIDTRKPIIMSKALDCGVDMLNDVSGFRSVEALDVAKNCINSKIAFCIMHMQGNPNDMQDCPRYLDVVAEVQHFLKTRYDALISIGVNKNNIVVDPGFGFGKTSNHNLDLLMQLKKFKEIAPVLVGISRKRIIAEMSDSNSLPVDRVGGSIAAAIWSALHGASIVRVHDVKETVEALKVFQRMDDSFSTN